jgi:hypothetical protein
LEEQPKLQQTILDAVRAADRREETGQMGKTIAEALIERGARKGKREGERTGGLRARQQTLLRQLGRRFGELPPDVVTTIESTGDIERLDGWLDRFATATRLEDVGIGPTA